MDVSLKALNKFNVVDGHMTVVTAIALKWNDELLSWDPQTNKNITELNLPLGKIWSPNLYLLNCAEKFFIYKGDPDTKEVEFSSNGEARLFFMEVFTTTCTSDIAYYPNDIHHCKIYLSTLTSSSKLKMGSAKVDTLDFETNGEWNLGNTKSEVHYLDSKNIERVVITINLERKMLFHMINVVAPVVFLGFVNVIVFKLPVESGERMSFAMTVLLSFAVYMTLVADKMPQTSNTTSVFCMYLMAMLIYSTLITIATTFSINCHHTKTNPLMEYFKRIQQTCIKLSKFRSTKTRDDNVEEMKFPSHKETKEKNTLDQKLETVYEDYAVGTNNVDFVFFVLFWKMMLFLISYIGVVIVLKITAAQLSFHSVDSCPKNQTEWDKRRLMKNCKEPAPDYHCAPIESNKEQLGEICSNQALTLEGFCPVINAVSHNLDFVECSTNGCPQKPFVSTEVYKYPVCFTKKSHSKQRQNRCD
ncbi:neuronal acetylcholine receptor subunit alpha-4-like, partial [Saccostrea cucullata]|uniref:neuronal acetylcholine receptor subunit alpha-4-like n=1 Tax=Saccostrea cuccullata TaxID=36930 RepID=UPI002ED2B304